MGKKKSNCHARESAQLVNSDDETRFVLFKQFSIASSILLVAWTRVSHTRCLDNGNETRVDDSSKQTYVELYLS